MSRLPHIKLMATYNTWMNSRLYAAVATLPIEEIVRDRRAFFGSMFGTLQHLLIADTIWLKRFAMHPSHHAALEPVRALPAPSAVKPSLSGDFGALAAQRATMDTLIETWAATLGEADLDHVLHYRNTRGGVFDREFFSLLMHFFNHQTHHRGQATTLLHQCGVDMGDTDLLLLIPQGSLQSKFI